MFPTRITEMLGIEFPIIQGAMHGLARAELVAAVSNAGGLGTLSAFTFPTSQKLRDEIRKTRSLTDKPFTVNITLLPTIHEANPEEYITAALDEGITVIETSGRSPEPFMKLFRDAGVKVMHKVTTVRHARTAERLGVDAVTIVGFEGAGHPGMDDVGSLTLIPGAVDSLKIPVIAAGGIGNARGFIAALALGAQGVLMGTRFMASRECHLPPKISQWLVEAGETDTLVIERSIRNAARVMKTAFSQKILDMEEQGATLQELLPLINGGRIKQALEEDDINAGVIPCGQAVGLIHDIPSVAEIIRALISDAERIRQRLNNTVITA